MQQREPEMHLDQSPPAPPKAETAVSMKDVEAMAAARQRIEAELRKRIVGQEGVIELLMISLFSGGHALFIGVPGLAKTLLIQTLAETVSLDFNRIQFTPDLMPSDITGTDILEEDPETRQRQFKFVKGPVFSNLLLADEINRTPPKTQAALLQAMQEKRVTAAGKTYVLEPPFLVFATQNPIEQEGTYPLPEAQLDRFMFSIAVDYPSFEEELEIVRRTTGAPQEALNPVLGQEELMAFQKVAEAIVVGEDIQRYAVEITRRTRPGDEAAPEVVKEYLAWGAGPRASQFLILGAKTRAALAGRPHASRADVRALVPAVLSHRILLTFQAEADGMTPEKILETIVQSIPESPL